MTKFNKNPSLLLSLSSAFEYYDFIIYGLMSSYIGALFFPVANPFLNQLSGFTLFTLGYVVRPIGGMIFGALGDLKSRKRFFIISNLFLAFATITISVLPSYNQIGIIAPIVIVMLRILQALGFAAELPGAMSIIQDSEKNPSKGFSFVISGASLGAILATFTVYLLEYFLTKQEILEFGWRIPFVLGAILCFVSMALRKNLPEKNYTKAENKLNLFSIIFSQYKNITAFMSLIALSSYLIMMNIFFPMLLPKFYNFQSKDIYLASGISLIWSVIYTPIYAYLVNKYNKINLYRNSILIAILLILFVNFLFTKQNLTILIISLCLYQTVISHLMVTIFPLMAEIFPNQARFTLIAICYNLTYLIISLTLPLLSNLAITWNSIFVIWGVFIAISLTALAKLNTLNDSV